MKIILFIIFSIFFSQSLSAEILKKVEVTGNKTTKIDAIISHAQIKVGEELTPEGLKEIKENLGRINQFILKKIEFAGGILKIEIEDKWTLFPVPMITQSGNYNSRGFLIYDDNFLGSLATFAPGVFWSNAVFNYLLYYQDESLFNPQTGIKILLIKRSEAVEFKRGNNIVDHHESLYYSYLITPNYLYKNHVFKAGPIFIDKTVSDKNSARILTDTPKGLFFRHHWNAFQVTDVMYDGFVTTFDIYALKSKNSKSIFRNEADISWSIPVLNHFLNFGVHGHYVNDRSYIFPKYLGGDEGYRGYDKSSLPASDNFGFLAQYQHNVYKRVFVSPFYEYNNSKLIDPILSGRRLSESTIGIGVRYYFKKISIPAVIFDMAKNIDDKSYHFHFNIGVSI